MAEVISCEWASLPVRPRRRQGKYKQGGGKTTSAGARAPAQRLSPRQQMPGASASSGSVSGGWSLAAGETGQQTGSVICCAVHFLVVEGASLPLCSRDLAADGLKRLYMFTQSLASTSFHLCLRPHWWWLFHRDR